MAFSMCFMVLRAAIVLNSCLLNAASSSSQRPHPCIVRLENLSKHSASWPWTQQNHSMLYEWSKNSPKKVRGVVIMAQFSCFGALSCWFWLLSWSFCTRCQGWNAPSISIASSICIMWSPSKHLVDSCTVFMVRGVVITAQFSCFGALSCWFWFITGLIHTIARL